ncbi:MAG TPA: ribosome maturation factor RimM [Trinickia sp.]|uniref:ribosome maturation factor RimM n=1 Tax=Trinickia sp. TaxID=2571163 RepID=UPI002D0BB969|nr:ribosome maturation factor RimM [Trinickia sp.]HTI17853.1 ribosome maturation factor RimM [Trinickia sp.]
MSAHDAGGSGRAKPAQRTSVSFGAFARKPTARRASESDAQAQGRPEPVEVWPDDAVEVGAIVDAYGLKGWVKVAAHASAGQGGDALLHGKRWWLAKGRERMSVQLTQVKLHAGHVVAHLGGLADRDDALALRGYSVYVRRMDFPTLSDDEFYWVDLVGLEVVNEAAESLGCVADLIDNGAHSVLRVEYPLAGKDGEPRTAERLIPFVGAYVKTVDQAAKRIVVDWQTDY